MHHHQAAIAHSMAHKASLRRKNSINYQAVWQFRTDSGDWWTMPSDVCEILNHARTNNKLLVACQVHSCTYVFDLQGTPPTRTNTQSGKQRVLRYVPTDTNNSDTSHLAGFLHSDTEMEPSSDTEKGPSVLQMAADNPRQHPLLKSRH
eukprot:TRINITY_DN5725_c0_g1_i1.p1 TRINITY_DN5725_c0_g1~~TRINITY_DN5725_c0_g1_i1.p1  ORF type:complete len:158 (-),score=3.59 TRINITY_DN5725_c0_g1_i1:179-622(-)